MINLIDDLRVYELFSSKKIVKEKFCEKEGILFFLKAPTFLFTFFLKSSTISKRSSYLFDIIKIFKNISKLL